MTTDETVEAILRWGNDKGLDDPKAQLNKVIEEVGEIAHEVTRNQYGHKFEDAIGDSLVTIIILSGICGVDPRHCLKAAYNEIRWRKGHTESGSFIKEDKSEDERVNYQSY